MKARFPYKFEYHGKDGVYLLSVTADTTMYRIYFPDGKSRTGSAVSVIENVETHPLKKYEGGLLLSWIYNALTSFSYRISAIP